MAFWRYVLALAGAIAENGLIPVVCGVGLPEQVLANDECAEFAGVHFLALVCSPDVLVDRIRKRAGAESAVRRVGRHVAMNAAIKEMDVPAPHSSTFLDTTELTVEETMVRAVGWANGLIA